jgi:hypothetical protein
MKVAAETVLLACVTLLLAHHLYSTHPASSKRPGRQHVAAAAY